MPRLEAPHGEAAETDNLLLFTVPLHRVVELQLVTTIILTQVEESGQDRMVQVLGEEMDLDTNMMVVMVMIMDLMVVLDLVEDQVGMEVEVDMEDHMEVGIEMDHHCHQILVIRTMTATVHLPLTVRGEEVGAEDGGHSSVG